MGLLKPLHPRPIYPMVGGVNPARPGCLRVAHGPSRGAPTRVIAVGRALRETPPTPYAGAPRAEAPGGTSADTRRDESSSTPGWSVHRHHVRRHAFTRGLHRPAHGSRHRACGSSARAVRHTACPPHIEVAHRSRFNCRTDKAAAARTRPLSMRSALSGRLSVLASAFIMDVSSVRF